MGYLSSAISNNEGWQTGNGAMAGNSIFKQTKKTMESKTSPYNANQKKLKIH